MDHLKKLYKAPFTYHWGYISDADGNPVADFMGEGAIHSKDPDKQFDVAVFRPRGYGRFKYMENGDALHDAMAAFLMEIVGNSGGDMEKCLNLLNKAWSKP